MSPTQPERDRMDTALFLKLAEPFEPGEVKFKPQAVKGNRALAIAYVDARLIMDRLDDVLGPNNWADAYTVHPNGSVECRLSVRVPGAAEWITKTDVGSESEQPDDGDKMKAAYSDALKRAAVKFGIGRFLYRMPMQWVDYDPVKKQFATPPRLPDWVLAGRSAPPNPAAKAPPPQSRPKPEPATADPIKVNELHLLLQQAGRTWESVRPKLSAMLDTEVGKTLDDLTQGERQALKAGLLKVIDAKAATAGA